LNLPLREDLLQPIAGENPSGKNLKYDRVFDQIKEARTEDDDSLPTGAWERQAKRADSNLVIKLAGETLATKTKDLQLAAWLGEAYIRKEGAAIIAPVLKLVLDLQKEFWETIHPEIDEGDVGLRAMPLQWACNRYAALIYELPIAKNGFSYITYKSGRALGYAADAENNDAKKKARDLALKRGQPTSEDVDDAIAGSPKSFYATLDPFYQDARDVLEDLALFCEEHYGDDGPSFRKLRDSLEEVHNIVSSLLSEKRLADPDPIAAPAPEPEPVVAAPVPVAAPAAPVPVAVAPAAAAPPVAAPARAAAPSAAGPPANWDEAVSRVHAAAGFMASERPGSSVPYLLHSAIRWGEIRKHAPNPPLELLVAPASEIRSGLKLAASEKSWSVVLTKSMGAMAEPCARCWLDLHRYIWTATRQSGYVAFSDAVLTAVGGILKDFPEMPKWTFSDDTPVANAETIQWIEDQLEPDAAQASVQSASPPVQAVVAAPPIVIAPRQMEAGSEASANGEPDVFTQASELALSGNLNAATAMLLQDSSRQASGRMRYKRRVEIAELCLAANSPNVAVPMLRELVGEIERRNLETWEGGEMVARPIALLLKCMNGDRTGVDWETNFARLCRLDPVAALEITP
jgi:type VI secretion system protein ImpA